MKTVLITGADRGIGFAMAERFLRGGWRVFAGQYMPQWKELEALKEKYPQQLTTVALDVSSIDSVRAAAAQIAQQTDTLDMLLSSAGIALDDTPKDIRKMISVNSIAAIRLTQTLLPLMENGEKRLCYVSSEAGSITTTQRDASGRYGMVCGYGLSKGILNMAVRQMFAQLRPKGFRFRLYNPGWVQSYIDGPLMQTFKYTASETAEVAFQRFTADRDWEDVLALVDIDDQAWSF